MDIREKLVELIRAAEVDFILWGFEENLLIDHLIANGVTVQETAHWVNVYAMGGECYGHCSNCLTGHKAQNYAALMYSYRHCKWCGAKMLRPLPEGE